MWGGDRLPQGPTTSAGEMQEGESIAGRGADDASQQREGAVTTCCGPLRQRVCGSEVPKDLFPPSHLCLGCIFQELMSLWHLW